MNAQSSPRFRIAALVVLVLLPGSVAADVVKSLFLPAQFRSLGELSLTTGTLDIDTDALTMTGFSGGQAAVSQSGNVELAVFAFDDINLGSGVTINVTGNRGLVLASKSDFIFDSTLNLSGDAGQSAVLFASGGAGGPGSDDGVPGVTTLSEPPGNTRGFGGNSTNQAGGDPLENSFGHGMGGGLQADTSGSYGGAGGGGGYGGAGGNGASPDVTHPGGVSYGDDVLTDLYGGSGGAGGRFQGSHPLFGGGGGGGGAVELIADGSLRFGGTIDVSGGKGGDGGNYLGGGGGSGGGVILAAPRVDLAGGTVNAKGGDAEFYVGPAPDNFEQGGRGGGGGGGRVAVYANHVDGLGAATVDVAGGAKGGGRWFSGHTDGAAGTYRYHGDGVDTRGGLTYPLAVQPLADYPELAEHWKLDEPAGSSTVSGEVVPGTHDGTLTPAGVSLGHRSAMSTLGTAAHFDRAQAGYITVPYDAALNPAQLTFEIWARADSLADPSNGNDYRSPVTSRGNATGYMFYHSYQNSWQFWVGDGTGWPRIIGPSVVEGQWVHLAGTHDGTNHRLYVNGSLAVEGTSAYVPNPSVVTTVGAGGGAGSSFRFDGALDGLAVFSKAYDEQTIADHYNSHSRYASRALDDNPVGYWRLGEQSGTTAYDAAGSHDGDYLSGVQIRQFDSALAYDDVDTAAYFKQTNGTKVDVPYDDALNPAGSFSLEFWAKPDGGTSHRSPITSRFWSSTAGWSGYMIYAMPDDYWSFWTGSDAAGLLAVDESNTMTQVRYDQWQHVVAVFEADGGPSAEGDYTGRMELWVNGVLAASRDDGVYRPVTNQAVPLRIGGGDTPNAGDFFFQGWLDEVAVYSYALTESQILAHLNASVPEPSTLGLCLLGAVAMLLRRRRGGRSLSD